MTDDSRYFRGSRGGKSLRLSRISNIATGHALIVPMDHSVTIGPLGSVDRVASVLQSVARAGADAVVLHRGRAAQVEPGTFARMGLIVHLSAGTNRSLDADAKVMVGGVEDALRVGADAVSVHVNVGSTTEHRQLEDFWAVSRECEILGVPLLAMMYARGPLRPEGPETADEVAHLASIATDLGADLVKVNYTGDPDSMRTVVETCPVPIYVAGGSREGGDDVAVALGVEIMTSGVAGLSFGRNIFAATNPYAVTAKLSQAVHGRGDKAERETFAHHATALESA
ncbi:2-amino-3,7-dideoxy-D-threo-hept-6-ulosonate synthase [Williamsia sp.]|uniref:2-amino-3,7-dideoxy-D-threo-hept-6-ulosonate synthase n=1 Tax=Williamsia sp. TaxID=1872085 RepID=UPI002F92F385